MQEVPQEFTEGHRGGHVLGKEHRRMQARRERSDRADLLQEDHDARRVARHKVHDIGRGGARELGVVVTARQLRQREALLAQSHSVPDAQARGLLGWLRRACERAGRRCFHEGASSLQLSGPAARDIDGAPFGAATIAKPLEFRVAGCSAQRRLSRPSSQHSS